MIAAYPAARHQLPALRYRQLYQRALNRMMLLSRDDERPGVYWLAWRHLAQPCLSLDEVENALADGSPWRQLVARVGRGER